MSTLDPSTVILQGVVAVEESNGVVNKVRASFASKASGERFEKLLEYNVFLNFKGAAMAITLFRKRGSKPSKGSDQESEEEESLEDKKTTGKGAPITNRRKTRSSDKVSEKSKTIKQNPPPKTPINCGKGDDHFEPDAKDKAKAPPKHNGIAPSIGTTHSNNPAATTTSTADVAPVPKDPVNGSISQATKGVASMDPNTKVHTNSPPDNKSPSTPRDAKDDKANSDLGDETDNDTEDGEIDSDRVNIVSRVLEKDITDVITNEEYFALMEEYRLVCKKDMEWVDKQLTRLGLEVPPVLGKDLVERVELEGSTVPPTDADLERGYNLKVDMVLYNCKDTSVKHLAAITKTKIVEVDTSSNNSAASVGLRIAGVFNGIRAIINVVRSAEACDLRFRQAIDGFDKERSAFVGGVNGVIKNQDLWRETLINEVSPYGTVKQVGIFKKSITVTFSRPREALFFEKRTIQLSIGGAEVTLSRSPYAILRYPADVAIEGFFMSDKEIVLQAVIDEAGPISRLLFINKAKSGTMAVTFPNFEQAEKLVRLRKLTITRGQSNVGIEVTVDWLRDSNTRVVKKEENESSSSGISQDSVAILAKLTALDTKLKEDKKAGLQEFKRLAKEISKSNQTREDQRKGDHMLMWQLVAESQNRLVNAFSSTMVSMMDKQAAIGTLSLELADKRSERQLLNFHALWIEGDPTKSVLAANMQKRCKDLDVTIMDLEAQHRDLLLKKIDTPCLPPPSFQPLSITGPSRNDNKRNNEPWYVPPDAEMVEKLTKYLDKAFSVEEASRDAWASEYNEYVKMNLMKMSVTWSFATPISISEKEIIIGKLQAFVTVFQGTSEAKNAGVMVCDLENAVLKEMEAKDNKKKSRKK